MFARNVSINLRPNTLSDFLKTMENEIVPLLRKHSKRPVVTVWTAA